LRAEAVNRLGVLGWPLTRSLSPPMHNAALRALGMADWRYQALPVPPELFAETVKALAGSGFRGANVTIPHKAAAFALADRPSEAAREIGAVNTLTFLPDGAIEAENTDAPGLLDALALSPRGLSALVLGAGGSAQAVVWALRQAGAREISVWNRPPEQGGSDRARALAQKFDVRLSREPTAADLLVNCTPLTALREGAAREDVLAGGESGESLRTSATERHALNSLPITFDQVGSYPHVVDLVYTQAQTPLLAAARTHGAHTVDGRDFLLAQGTLSFERWTGATAPREVMRRALAEAR
jgi:shikimate dehydrogenase